MSVSISGINGYDYSAIINSTTTGGLESSLSQINELAQAVEDAKMYKACKEFEQYMVEQIYKSMEKTIMKADEEENEYEQYFGDMRIQKYAEAVSNQGNIGLAEQLYEAMKRNQGGVVIHTDAE